MKRKRTHSQQKQSRNDEKPQSLTLIDLQKRTKKLQNNDKKIDIDYDRVCTGNSHNFLFDFNWIFFFMFFCDFLKLYLHCIMYRKNEEEREWMKRARKGGNRKKKSHVIITTYHNMVTSRLLLLLYWHVLTAPIIIWYCMMLQKHVMDGSVSIYSSFSDLNTFEYANLCKFIIFLKNKIKWQRCLLSGRGCLTLENRKKFKQCGSATWKWRLPNPISFFSPRQWMKWGSATW